MVPKTITTVTAISGIAIVTMATSLSSVAVKPPTSGGGYKATPQSCLHTDGI